MLMETSGVLRVGATSCQAIGLQMFDHFSKGPLNFWATAFFIDVCHVFSVQPEAGYSTVNFGKYIPLRSIETNNW